MSSNKKRKAPKIIIETVDDLYSYYRFFIGLDHELVENLPIYSLKRLAENKVFIESWINQEV